MATRAELTLPSGALSYTVGRLPPVVTGFGDGAVLAGFMGKEQFHAFRDEQQPNMKAAARRVLWAEYDVARGAAEELGELESFEVVVERIAEGARIERLKKQPIFARTFGSSSYSFALINPAAVVVEQTFVRLDSYPKMTAKTLFNIAFPDQLTPDFEVAEPTRGTFHLISTNPFAIANEPVLREVNPGVLTVTMAEVMNWVQLVHYGDFYFCKNGHHRLVRAMELGFEAVPALVIESPDIRAASLVEHIDFFSARELAGMRRPPVVADFFTEAAIPMSIRKQRGVWFVKVR
jgi:hypothetical protein